MGDRRHGRWAEALFGRGLELYARRAAANGGLAPKHMFGVHTRMEEFDCFCARMLANAAARAVALGLGSKPAQDPPPPYAFHADTGRPRRHHAALLDRDPRRQPRRVRLDPARLFGPGQAVALARPGALAVRIAPRP